MSQSDLHEQEPYGTRPGEGRSKSCPTDAELLTVANILHKCFVEHPRRLIQLTKCYVPIAADPPRKVSRQLFNEIEAQLGPCVGYSFWFDNECRMPDSFVRWLIEENPELFDAIDEYAITLAALKEAIDQLEVPLSAALTVSATEKQLDDYYRPPVPSLKPELLADVDRTVNGVEILLGQCRRILEESISERAAEAERSESSAGAADAKTQPPIPAAALEQLAEAIGDENAARVISIANRRDSSAERKMEEILQIDPRFAGKDSHEWAKLLGVSDAAIRKTATWKHIRRAQADE
jgi:NTP pyrophosphatase (non-canonical NTP hydrolase)